MGHSPIKQHGQKAHWKRCSRVGWECRSSAWLWHEADPNQRDGCSGTWVGTGATGVPMVHPTPSHVEVHYVRAMLAQPVRSLPPPRTFPSGSKGSFQNAAVPRHSNKTTTLIFLAEASTKRKPFSGFLFSPPGPLILLDQAHLC